MRNELAKVLRSLFDDGPRIARPPASAVDHPEKITEHAIKQIRLFGVDRMTRRRANPQARCLALRLHENCRRDAVVIFVAADNEERDFHFFERTAELEDRLAF